MSRCQLVDKLKKCDLALFTQLGRSLHLGAGVVQFVRLGTTRVLRLVLCFAQFEVPVSADRRLWDRTAATGLKRGVVSLPRAPRH